VHPSHGHADDPSELHTLLQAIGGLVQALRTMKTPGESDNGARSILSTLYRCGPVRPSDLAGSCMLDVSTVSRHARQLELDGLVAKIADPEDRRAHRLALTESGIEKIEFMWSERMSVLEERLAAWSEEDMHDLARLSSRFCADLGVTEQHGFPTSVEVRETHLAALNTLHAPEREGSQK
jgi:DNA-binding MarR family transcriptional regulator